MKDWGYALKTHNHDGNKSAKISALNLIDTGYTKVHAGLLANQNLPVSSTWYDILFDDIFNDELGELDTSNGRFTPLVKGWYDFIFACGFASNAVGVRHIQFTKNGSGMAPSWVKNQTALNGFATIMSIPARIFLLTTDYVNFQAWQNTGGALNADKSFTQITITRALIQ